MPPELTQEFDFPFKNEFWVQKIQQIEKIVVTFLFKVQALWDRALVPAHDTKWQRNCTKWLTVQSQILDFSMKFIQFWTPQIKLTKKHQALQQPSMNMSCDRLTTLVSYKIFYEIMQNWKIPQRSIKHYDSSYCILLRQLL